MLEVGGGRRRGPDHALLYGLPSCFAVCRRCGLSKQTCINVFISGQSSYNLIRCRRNCQAGVVQRIAIAVIAYRRGRHAHAEHTL
ncbi:Unknown protein sequence [Pseudomonas syringae pv. cilantro]|uniref:Uncharacterized protein n=1 Tax=Pseudomonas syringae pv. cilantro TaxID=81035 RepID=A0A0N0XBN0_PSESX|nr:Unknown protein sequence [Pseudomonas syringae pv. cilantro]